MQMVKKITAILFVVWFVLILFMPKEEIYFRMEQELAKNEIKLNEEHRNEGLFSLNLENVTVYVKGIPLATVEKISFFTLLFHTCINVEALMIDESLKAMTPTEVEHLHISQNILSPFDIKVKAEGPFGQASGSVDLNQRMVHMDINETKGLGMLKSKLKQGEEGWVYETSF